MPCPICIGSAMSTIAQGAGLIGVAKHVHDKANSSKAKQKTNKSPKSKNKNK